VSHRLSRLLPNIDPFHRQKMSLYTDIQTTIDEHKKVLEDRSKELAGAKRDLVKRSGSAIGEQE